MDVEAKESLRFRFLEVERVETPVSGFERARPLVEYFVFGADDIPVSAELSSNVICGTSQS